MTSKSTKIIAFVSAIIAGIIGLNALNILPVSAVDNVCNTDASAEVKAAAGCSGYSTGDKLPSVVTNILEGIILVMGLVAVVFIIIGGVQYITSTGDPSKTKKAKDTILYSVIGLIVCVLAFAIVNFVVQTILKQN